MVALIALLLVSVVAWRVMSKEQRIKVLQTIDVALAVVKEHGRADLERFHAARRARTRWPVAAPALAALSVAIFMWAPAAKEGATVVPWGASFGPLTSNGQWWRLFTAIFVNRSAWLLVVNAGAIIQLGLTLERIVGGPMFAAAFVIAGIFSGLAGLSSYPMGVVAGPAGAIWGLYGMLLVVGVPLWRRQSDLAIPLVAIERLAAIFAIFALMNLPSEAAGGAAQLAGLPAGIALGIVAAWGVAARTPPPRLVGIAAGAALLDAIVCAIPLRGILDVRPEIARIVGVEKKTSTAYQAANDLFRKGKMTADTLAEIIERSIVPELQAASARLDTLHGVPAEDMPRMADAREFLRLRSESWRLRAQSLRMTGKSVRGATRPDGDSDMAYRQRVQTQYQSTLIANGKADGAERASLAALDRLQQPAPKPDR